MTASPTTDPDARPARPRPRPSTDDALRMEYTSLEDLRAWPSNPKDHDQGAIAGAIGRWGFLNPVLVDERTGLLNAGHGRLKTLTAMREQGQSPPRYVRVEPDGSWSIPVVRGWSSASDADAAARAVSDNRVQELGDWNDAALADVLTELARAGDGALEGVGFDGDDVDALLERLGSGGYADTEGDEDEGEGADGEGGAGAEGHDDGGADGDDEGGPAKGTLLDLVGVTLDEPERRPTRGEVWRCGPHYLAVADVFTGHPAWAPLLKKAGEGAVFVPYPGPYVALGERVTRPGVVLVMVQPDTYLAGHLLDRYADVHGPAAVTREASA